MSAKTCLSYWFPIIEAAGLPVPETRIVRPEYDLTSLLDCQLPEGWGQVIDQLETAAKDVGLPCFLRTGQTSHKHDWKDSCLITDVGHLPSHVANLVEFSHMCDLFGLPHDVWVVRRMIPTTPLFHAFYGRMPITREFRFFVRDGAVEHVQAYWPAAAIKDKNPSVENWQELLAAASVLGEDEAILRPLAEVAGLALGGYWSVDFLQDSAGKWWLTDMAEGDRSFRYDPKETA